MIPSVLVETLWQDVWYGARGVLRNTRVSVPLIATVALGIGAVTTVFTLVSAVLLRPLPYPEPSRLIYIREDIERIGPVPFVRPAEYLAWSAGTQSLSGLGAYLETHANLATADGAERVTCGSVTSSFFPMLGVRPVLGRSFEPGEDQAGAPRVAMLSHAFWQRAFGAEPSALGSTITLDGTAHTIVGILPADVIIPDRYGGSVYDVWIPFSLGGAPGSNPPVMRAVARLKPGVSLEQAHAELDAMLQATITRGASRRVLVSEWQHEVAGAAKRPLLGLFAAVSVILLIACVNVANLLLARAAARRHEIAVRRALGAGRLRIVRQLLTESLVLAGVGGALGLATAYWGHHVLAWHLARTLPALDPIGIDWRVLAFAGGVTLLTGVIFGLAPAVSSSRVSPASVMQAAQPGARGSGRRLRTGLVVLQLAAATVLLIAGATLVKSLLELRATAMGFDEDRVLTVKLNLTRTQYPTPADQARFFEAVLDRIRTIDGIEWAGATTALPFSGAGGSADVLIEGEPHPTRVELGVVTPDYFRVMGIPVKEGRFFLDADRDGAPRTVIVNEAFARRYCPDARCAVSRLKFGGNQQPWLTIVGVVGDVRASFEEAAGPGIYLSYLQMPVSGMTIVARTRTEPAAFAGVIRSQIAAVANDQPAYDVATLRERRSKAIAPRQATVVLVGIFSVLALMLGAVGIYGLIAYSVALRTREIGVRMALGAERADVIGLILRQGFVTIAAGLAIGCVAALAANRLASSAVSGVITADAWTYLQVALAWGTIAAAACWGPARQAARLSPLNALRHE
jgi:putative ABC transport system permease protein